MQYAAGPTRPTDGRLDARQAGKQAGYTRFIRDAGRYEHDDNGSHATLEGWERGCEPNPGSVGIEGVLPTHARDPAGGRAGEK